MNDGPAAVAVALVAEDDADMRLLLRVFLESRGWRVVALANGRETLGRVTSERFVLAVVDVRSTVSHGMALFRALRARDERMPIIATTSFGDTRVRAQVVALGAAAVLEKPFELEDLGGALERCG